MNIEVKLLLLIAYCLVLWMACACQCLLLSMMVGLLAQFFGGKQEKRGGEK